MAKKLILDLDTGIDDALALAYALGSPELELIGVTTTYGNVLLEQGIHNDLALLDLLGHHEIPVYPGEPHALRKKKFEVQPISAFIHGQNGVGDVDLPPSSREPEKMSAVDFIIESAHAYGRDLIFVPTGPQTNLATAIEKAPEIINEIGKVVLMGGALTVCGNVSPWAEANISQDPDAANYVFRSGIHSTMIGLDVTLQTLLTVKETSIWRDYNTPAATIFADMTDYYIKAYETTAPKLGGCGLHDPLAVGVAADPALVRTLPINMQVDTEGATRGRTIGRNEKLNDPIKTSQVAVQVEVKRFLEEFMKRIGSVIQQ